MNSNLSEPLDDEDMDELYDHDMDDVGPYTEDMGDLPEVTYEDQITESFDRSLSLSDTVSLLYCTLRFLTKIYHLF